jgi:hypothetical protein
MIPKKNKSLKRHVKTCIKDLLDEMTSSGAVGAYSTPFFIKPDKTKKNNIVRRRMTGK